MVLADKDYARDTITRTDGNNSRRRANSSDGADGTLMRPEQCVAPTMVGGIIRRSRIVKVTVVPAPDSIPVFWVVKAFDDQHGSVRGTGGQERGR